MMWDLVVEAWLDLLEADTALETELGGDDHIYPAQSSRAARIPSVEWSLVGDLEEESFNPITIQVDIFAKNVRQMVTIERRIRLLTHRDTARVLGGLRMWTRYLDSRSHDYPAQPGAMHRSLDFQFEPLRAKYASL